MFFALSACILLPLQIFVLRFRVIRQENLANIFSSNVLGGVFPLTSTGPTSAPTNAVTTPFGVLAALRVVHLK